VAIANDPVNGGRGLQLLAQAGLIKLKPGKGFKATEDDIIANPKQLKLIQIELVQLVRAYDEMDLIQGYPHHILLSKHFDANSALMYEGGKNKDYIIRFAIRPESKNDPRIAKFVDIYHHAPEVKAALDKAYGNLYKAAWEN